MNAYTLEIVHILVQSCIIFFNNLLHLNLLHCCSCQKPVSHMSLLQRNSTESVIRTRFGGMVNPLCENTRTTGADDEAILNDTVKSRSLLPALVLLGLTIRGQQMARPSP